MIINVAEEIGVRIGGEKSISFFSDAKGIIGETEDKEIILDFGGVEFIDSSGLGSLVAINSYLLKEKKRLILRNVDEYLMELLRITGLAKILNFEKSEEE